MYANTIVPLCPASCSSWAFSDWRRVYLCITPQLNILIVSAPLLFWHVTLSQKMRRCCTLNRTLGSEFCTRAYITKDIVAGVNKEDKEGNKTRPRV